MGETPSGRETWLVAAWPGMGSVGVGAVAYLVNSLRAALVHEMPARDVFDLSHIDVQEGVAKAGRLPRSMFFLSVDTSRPRDLLIFIGEAQPPVHGFAYCHRLLDFAASRGVSRVFTFAAMATQLHPSNEPRVFGVTTEPGLIADLKAREITILKEGQISGLNGVLLAAAAERKIPGVCLLGELPFFAAAIPNPRASQAVLESFSAMAGVEIDYTELHKQGEAVEKGLIELLERMQEAARQQRRERGEPEDDEEEGAGGEFVGGAGSAEGGIVGETGGSGSGGSKKTAGGGSGSKEPTVDEATKKKIEAMFEAAMKDRTQAFALKQELDRLGVFKRYENRFLDLFKKGE